jgi:hypothetical protein
LFDQQAPPGKFPVATLLSDLGTLCIGRDKAVEAIFEWQLMTLLRLQPVCWLEQSEQLNVAIPRFLFTLKVP